MATKTLALGIIADVVDCLINDFNNTEKPGIVAVTAADMTETLKPHADELAQTVAGLETQYNQPADESQVAAFNTAVESARAVTVDVDITPFTRANLRTIHLIPPKTIESLLPVTED